MFSIPTSTDLTWPKAWQRRVWKSSLASTFILGRSTSSVFNRRHEYSEAGNRVFKVYWKKYYWQKWKYFLCTQWFLQVTRNIVSGRKEERRRTVTIFCITEGRAWKPFWLSKFYMNLQNCVRKKGCFSQTGKYIDRAGLTLWKRAGLMKAGKWMNRSAQQQLSSALAYFLHWSLDAGFRQKSILQ